MKEEVFLMHKDIKVAKLTRTSGYYNVLEIYNKEHMPVSTRNATNDMPRLFMYWIKNRCISNQRPNINNLIINTGYNNITDLAIDNLGLSLTDCYWFKPIDKDIKWDDINFHKNGFKSNVGELLFKNDFTKEINTLISPDITTNGCLPKMWIQDENNKFFLVKDASAENIKDGHIDECVNEVFAYEVSKLLNVPTIPYFLLKIANSDKICCACPSFIEDDKHEFVSMEQFWKEHPKYTRKDIYNMFCDMGYEKEMNGILILDFLTGNGDRHHNNIGIIRNPDTLKIEGLCINFDNGACMQYNYQSHQVNDMESNLITRYALDELKQVKYFDCFKDADLKYIDLIRLYEKIASSYIPQEARMALRSALANRMQILQEMVKDKQNDYRESYDIGER